MLAGLDTITVIITRIVGGRASHATRWNTAQETIITMTASLERILGWVNQHVMHAQDVLQGPAWGGIVSGSFRLVVLCPAGLPHPVSHAPPPTCTNGQRAVGTCSNAYNAPLVCHRAISSRDVVGLLAVAHEPNPARVNTSRGFVLHSCSRQSAGSL